jgi:S-adenosylmethionine hydrolase
MKRPVITLLTDFGIADHYVAAMKGVILTICPQAELVDISHDVTPFAIAEGAYALAQAWRYFPKGTVHLAVVDPGVGSARRAIVAEVSGHRFVAPDNGLLTMVLESGPSHKIREITAWRYFHQPVSNTFHGRDIFAPVAAHLAKGVLTSRLGKLVVDPVVGSFAKPIQLSRNRWLGTILKVDRFGNIITNFDWATFQSIASARFGLKLAGKALTTYSATYADAPAGKLFAIHGSTGYIEISINQSHAASMLGASPGVPVELKLT